MSETQLVIFNIQDEEFGIEVSRIKEVLKYTKITRIPEAGKFIEGVINLRNHVIPVVSLGTRLGLYKEEKDRENKQIIIVEIEEEYVGLIVDSVSEVLRVPDDSIDPPPETGTKAGTEMLKGVGKYDDKLIIILELDNIFSGEEKIDLESIRKQNELREQQQETS